MHTSTSPSESTEPRFVDYFEEISNYLPLELRNPDENQYFRLHVKAFIENQNANNDYALLALHHLFMLVCYGLLYCCLRRNMDITQLVFLVAPISREQRKQLMDISSLFTLSLVKERTFFDLMSAVGCDMTNRSSELKQLVDDRNDLAHCNGKFCIDFGKDVNKYINGFEILHEKYEAIIREHLLEIDEIDSDLSDDQQMDELITILSDNYVSRRMLEVAAPVINEKGLTNAHRLILNYLE